MSGEKITQTSERARTALEKAELINSLGKDVGVEIDITDLIREGKQRHYSADLDNLEGGARSSGGYLPVVIDGLESFLVSPPVKKDIFESPVARDDWAKTTLLPHGMDVLEYFKKNRLSKNTLISIGSALNLYASYNKGSNSEPARYASEIIERTRAEGDVLNLATYDQAEYEEKKATSDAYAEVCTTFLGKLNEVNSSA